MSEFETLSRKHLSELLDGYLKNLEATRTEPLYRCAECRDTAYVRGEPRRALGHVYETMRPCECCAAGQAILDGKSAQPMPKRHRGFRRSLMED